MKNKSIKKIICLGEDELDIQGLVKADVFIYYYEAEAYEGSGIAVWRSGNKWAYDHLSHCSCNGPTDTISTADNAKFSIKQIVKILTIDNINHSLEVAKYLKRYYL